jgi:hypothetical protein
MINFIIIYYLFINNFIRIIKNLIFIINIIKYFNLIILILIPIFKLFSFILKFFNYFKYLISLVFKLIFQNFLILISNNFLFIKFLIIKFYYLMCFLSYFIIINFPF